MIRMSVGCAVAIGVNGFVRALALLLIALFLGLAFAGSAEVSEEEPAAHQLGPVVVTASREPLPSESAPGTFSVIAREEIERGHYTSVVDILRRVPGLHVGQPGSRGGRASIYMRGLDPNHTLVLIDGVRMNDPTNNRGGSFDLSTLDPAGIERIEISRGPISAVHGSDAIAGVINIITRTGRDAQEFLFDGSGGRWGVYRVAGEARGRVGIADLSLAGAWVDEGNPPDDQEYRGGNIKADVGLELPAGASLRGTFRFADSESESFPDYSGGDEFAVIRTLEERDIREFDMRVEAAQKTGRWINYALGFDYRHRREDIDNPGIAPGDGAPIGYPSASSRNELDHYAISLRNTVKPLEGLSLTAGGDVYWEDGSSIGPPLYAGTPFETATSFEFHRVVGGPFAELNWRSDFGLILYGGVRADFSDESSSEVTPRVSAEYPIPVVDLVVKGSWGEGFKLPAFFSLATPVVGNPNLVAERSKGWDLALSRSFWKDRIDGRIAYFEIEVRKLIDFVPALEPPLQNRSKVVSRGFEFELNAKLLDSLDFNGNLTFTDTDIRNTGDDLLNRPRWQGALTLAWTPVESLTVRASALIVGSVKDASAATGNVTLDPWGRVDLSAAWRVRKHVSLYVEIDNLFDSNYEEVVGFRAPGIRPRAGVRARF
ncbi:MAG: TonB-dependent receptor [Deltaproteobacteria bacterium]|nr:TonB-dependent receptor [Deltaproteobacteria bacterium]